MQNEFDNLDTIQDPLSLASDITGEREYTKKLLLGLGKINEAFPDKNYASLFYDRYIENLETGTICKKLNIDENEFYLRIIEIVKFINENVIKIQKIKK